MDSNKKFSYKHIIMTALLSAGVALGGSYLILDGQKLLTSTSSNTVTHEKFSQVENVFDFIKQNYVGEIDDTTLINGALTGMTDAIGDPYSNFLTGLSKDSLDETIDGEFEGIGATMSYANNLPFIVEPPIPGSPAEKEGLKVNDKIIKVDGKEIEGETLTDVVSKIRGKKGTNVTLTIEREGELMDVTLTRDVIPIQSVYPELAKDNKNIAVIRVTTFNGNTAQDFFTSIEKMRKEGAKQFVIDLRDNPGGSLQEVSSMSSAFLKDGEIIFQVEDSQGNKEKVKAGKSLDKGQKINEPIVVLVNENSASASEIFAAAIKENKRGEIMGTKTFGKGTMQTVQPLTEDTELKLTVNKWLTPDANWINKKGLKPTIEIKTPDYYSVKVMDKTNSMQLGSSGESVKSLNIMLDALGYSVDKTSDKFSEQTTEAVISFQKEHKIEVNGIVNKETATKIEEVLYAFIKENDNQLTEAINELSKS
ncbi:S41 family peptidase [Vagococcus xieshaowenii]|uniref:PDZ domain-containing protein n=1 Tax=Vagococcus xieshaowenii TaxID=2562451 RepID=A0AAJ5EGL4_9ENTE|nr:S41 family peptidase [Vagococcus xieshaowenii]QCA28477.1 PDZ domain-containing protein [Vagococcus xieshaowenii]TFZ42768.1 PDZ domain-containing protein [Vagococcus xieshaowenii]